MEMGARDVVVDRRTGLMITVADPALLARVLHTLRGDGARAMPVPDGYLAARDGEPLPRRADR